MNTPRITFACELETDSLQALFAPPEVADILLALKARVSLGTLDLSHERAALVRRLNELGIPVVAWLLLSKEQGYWFNASNAAQAIARYDAFKKWTAEHGLQWAGIGIDIEPDFREFQHLLRGTGWRYAPKLLERICNHGQLRRAQRMYTTLISQMRSDEYPVESYQFPFVVEERRARSTLLQRLFGVVDIPADREALMLYTSFQRDLGPGILCSYAPDAQMLVVGSVGGETEIEGAYQPLTWDELARDLRYARRWSADIGIYSLEGCVRQGFLPRLKTFNWEAPVTFPLRESQQVDRLRLVLRGILWASAHPILVFGGLIASVWILRRLLKLSGGKRGLP